VGWSRWLRHGRVVMLRLEGSRRRWEQYWRQLGIAPPSAGETGTEKISLALGWGQSDESSCANSAQKEESMPNAESLDTAPNAGTQGATAKLAQSPRRTTPKKSAAKEKRAKSRRHSGSGRTADAQSGTQAWKTARAAQRKPRAQSKGAQILALIGRAKGVTLPEIMRVTAWQAHSVRGFLSTAAKSSELVRQEKFSEIL
jgi:hypothetical protein